MAWDILIKPKFDFGGGGVVTSKPGTLVVYSADGEVLDTVQVGGARGHEGYKQEVSSIAQGLPAGAYIEFTPQGGTTSRYDITADGQRHEYSYGNPQPTLVSGKGAIGSIGSGGASGFEPGSSGGYGVFPKYLGDQFPNPTLVDYDPIEAASYDFVDPIDFAKAFGSFNREELLKNFDQSKKFALDTLRTELQGLEEFAPAASALKRRETALDNIFNQQQRTEQVNKVLPEARPQLDAQGARAESFAAGRIPDAVADRALELGVRSEAADAATAGGFGATSSVARKASDLLSAKERVNLSQYGDQLLTSNIGTKANLFLAPTSYSDAGQQIRVTPEVGAGRLTSQGFSELNANTLISPGAALSAEIGQQQFATNIRQRTSEFNASNQFSASQINAGYENQFALQKFGYDVDYAGIVAGAGQVDVNTGIAQENQDNFTETFDENKRDTQKKDEFGQAVDTGVSIVTTVLGFGGLSLDTPDGFTDEVNTDNQITYNFGNDAIPVPRSATTPRQANATGTTTPRQDNALGKGLKTTPGFQNKLDSIEAVVGGPLQLTEAQQQNIQNYSKSIFSSVGISSNPRPGYVATSVDSSGNPVYVNPKLAESNDGAAGSRVLTTVENILTPLNIFGAEDATLFRKMVRASSDQKVKQDLDTKKQDGDKKGFITATLGALGTSPKENKSAAFAAGELFDNWDNMSPAQQSLAISSLGLKSYKDSSGRSLYQKPVIEKEGNTPGLSTGEALNLFSKGYNVYALKQNWKDFNDLAKAAGTDNSAEGVAGLAQQFRMLGAGQQGGSSLNLKTTQDTTTVQGINGPINVPRGSTPAPAAGPGAITLPANAKLPVGYVQVGQAIAGMILAIPAKNRGQAAFAALGTNALGNALGAAGIFGLSKGSKKIYSTWKESISNPSVRNVIGGSAAAAGLGSAAYTAPFLAGASLAINTVSNLVGSVGGVFGVGGGGKSGDQKARDGVRSSLQKVGAVDSDYQVTLANGTKVDVGVDGKGGMSEGRHPYDLDYKNDLAFSVGMGGIALGRLVSGEKSTATDQVGSQLANAALSDIGSKDFTEANYNKAMQNMRAIYAQSGIKSKAEAYQLANQAFSEGRLSAFDLVQAQQAANMLFDPGSFTQAQKLMSGRQRGVEVAEGNPPTENTKFVHKVQQTSPTTSSPIKRFKQPIRTKQELAAINASRYGGMAA